ncbi:ABC transporter substrate-binding protein [Parasulfuritortus cantonensis]|uniref:ABC transporter substrate-binding protein n=2 Tax=Parasulfuritortus cantonensis TaxID=2528202 RepID=A0A4R1BMQ3_9PROT|nr:ABC transporter substrate-binding protein [Parasulfuritortus cantonensis]
MAGRQVHIPDQVHKVYAVGHCVPAVAAVAPDKLANNGRLPAAAARYLAPAFLAGKAVPKAGMRFSDEEILRMAPDLVVMETMPGAADQAARLEAKLRVPVLLIDQDLLRFKQTFAFLGEVLGRPEQAQALAGFVATYIDPIGSKARIIPVAKRVRVYYAEGPDGLSTNPAGSSHTQVLDYVGGINAARVANLPDEGMAKVSLEQLYLWRPDRILVWTPAADQLTTWHAVVDGPLWQRLDAVKAGRVSQIPWLPYSWFDRPPGSNRILGVLWLANLLYPEVFPFDMVAVTREYFRLFYHADLSAADARYLLGLATPAAAAEPSR